MRRVFYLTSSNPKSILIAMEDLKIRPVTEEDAPAITGLYNPYITNTTITFEEEPVSAEEMLQRIHKVLAIPFPWLCAEVNGRLAGYAYAARWRERSAYRFVAESTIYMDPAFSGQGIGRQLYIELLNQLRAAGMHTVMGVITIPNPASIALHESLGFVKVAHFPEVGYKFNQWLDVGYWQLTFAEACRNQLKN